MQTKISLADLGWRPALDQQLLPEERDHLAVARVSEQHRSGFRLLGPAGEQTLALTPDLPELAVGDWLLLDGERCVRRLERFSLFQRQEAGERGRRQSVAANIDCIFLVTSANADFNPSRLERYLALVHSAGAIPVVVITKIDLGGDADAYLDAARALDPELAVVAVNALDGESCTQLRAWLGPGQTVALLGSSGVGKSTLVNILLGHAAQSTSAIREDDAKGRHTTTARSLHLVPGGGLLLDTPGMRELGLTADTDAGASFADVEALAANCRFNDCQHESEPGCAVREAVNSGALDERRLQNYGKLQREQNYQQESEGQRRARQRALGKHYLAVQKGKRR